MTRHTAVLDTMILLHFRPVGQIDWFDVVGAENGDQVDVLITGITLREIDEHKNHSPKLRDRARRVSKELGEWLDGRGSPLPRGLAVRSALRQPAMADASLGLDASVNDDVLVAAALEYQAAHPDTRVVLVTTDAYPATRARDLGLAVAEPSGTYALPLEEDVAERRAKELERELQRLRASRPVLDLRFAGDGKTLRATLDIPGPLTEAERTKALEEAGRQVRPGETFRPEASRTPRTREDAMSTPAPKGVADLFAINQSVLNAIRPISDEEIARYEKDREAYLVAFGQYLEKERQVARRRAHRVAVRLEVLNEGSAPANDIDVYVHVPDGVGVTAQEGVEAPTPPDRPVRPRTATEILRDGLRVPTIGSALGLGLHDFTRDFGSLNRQPPNVSGFSIKRSNSYDVRCHVARVKHHQPIALPVFYVVVPEGQPVRPLQMAYTVHAAELPQPVAGVLNLVLRTA